MPPVHAPQPAAPPDASVVPIASVPGTTPGWYARVKAQEAELLVEADRIERGIANPRLTSRQRDAGDVAAIYLAESHRETGVPFADSAARLGKDESYIKRMAREGTSNAVTFRDVLVIGGKVCRAMGRKLVAFAPPTTPACAPVEQFIRVSGLVARLGEAIVTGDAAAVGRAFTQADDAWEGLRALLQRNRGVGAAR